MKFLSEEHDNILHLLDRIEVLPGTDNPDRFIEFIRRAIQLLREYADQYHHQKEEDWLFPFLKSKNELLGDGILHSLLEQHEDMRQELNIIEAAINKSDIKSAQKLLADYCRNLRDHIAAEEDELFPMAENLLTEYELDELSGRFEDNDRNLGKEKKAKYENMIHEFHATS